MSGVGTQLPIIADGPTPEATDLEAAQTRQTTTPPSFQGALQSNILEGGSSALARAGERGQASDASWLEHVLADPMEGLAGAIRPDQDAKLPAQEINRRYAPEGESITDQPMSPKLGEILGHQMAQKAIRDSILARADNTYSLPARFGTGALAFLMDPLQAASVFVPGVGEEAILARLGYATGKEAATVGSAAAPGLLTRLGVRAASGFSGGVAAQAPLSAIRLSLANQVDDYNLRQASLDLMFAGGLNAFQHAGLMGGLRELGVLKPDEMMRALDMPPGARYDAMKTGISQLMEERPVEVGPIADQAMAEHGGTGAEPPNPAQLAAEQRARESQGYAQGMAQPDFNQAVREVYGPEGQEGAAQEGATAREPEPTPTGEEPPGERPVPAEGAGEGEAKTAEAKPKTPEEAQLQDLEDAWARRVGPDETAQTRDPELAQSRAALDQAQQERQGFDQAAQCLKDAGI